MSPLTTKSTKFEVQIQDPLKHSSKTKKPRKSSRRSQRRTENRKSQQMARKVATQKNGKEELRKAQNYKTPPERTPPNTLNASSLPLIDIIMFLLSTTRLAKSSTNFVLILSPFRNELIKHQLREEQDAIHEIQN
jgi:hypothetical protein